MFNNKTGLQEMDYIMVVSVQLENPFLGKPRYAKQWPFYPWKIFILYNLILRTVAQAPVPIYVYKYRRFQWLPFFKLLQGYCAVTVWLL